MSYHNERALGGFLFLFTHTFLVCCFQVCAKVYEEDESTRLQRQTCLWCSFDSARAEDWAAASPEPAASIAFLEEPVSGPGWCPLIILLH